MFESSKQENQTYEDFKNSIISEDELFENLEIEVVQRQIFYHFNLSVNGFKFANYVPCLKYDNEDYILEKVILPRKKHWYNQYIEKMFEDFIKNNGVTESETEPYKRLYVYEKSPLETISFSDFNFKRGKSNYNKLESVKLFDYIDIRGNKIKLYRVK